jgi:hypothetical protein
MKWTSEKLRDLEKAIPWGRENQIIADRIQEVVKCAVERRTQWPAREGIKKLILLGCPACSDGRGYWRTELPEELEEYAVRLESRRRAVKKRINALNQAALKAKPGVRLRADLDITGELFGEEDSP